VAFAVFAQARRDLVQPGCDRLVLPAVAPGQPATTTRQCQTGDQTPDIASQPSRQHTGNGQQDRQQKTELL